MKSLVTGASSHGGGWDQIVIGKVCSQSLDPNNYTTCSTASGHIELADLIAFLSLGGRSGVGRRRTGRDDARYLVGRCATTSDPGAPTTTIACNGAPCSSDPYAGVVSVTLSATDIGSGVLEHPLPRPMVVRSRAVEPHVLERVRQLYGSGSIHDRQVPAPGTTPPATRRRPVPR